MDDTRIERQPRLMLALDPAQPKFLRRGLALRELQPR